jgi:hypothetical protein
MNPENPSTVDTNQASSETYSRNLRGRGRQRAPGQTYRPYKIWMLILNISLRRSMHG